MPIPPLVGHLEPQRRLRKAVQVARLPPTLLLVGPYGVGKQRFALWTAQLLLCTGPESRPCGECRSCRLVLGLAHPDVHWFFPVARPKAADSDKQLSEIEDALAQAMAERRARPIYQRPDGLAGYFVATARLIQREAALTPVEGRQKIFVIGEAERLVPQEASPDAANALLKLFEEPPADTQFILTAVQSDRLLPTIRSRAVPIRLGRLSDDDVREFLRAHADPPLSGKILEERVVRAQGSIGAALDPGAGSGAAVKSAAALLDAVLAGSAQRMEQALKQSPWAARGDFSAMLDALEESLSEAARVAVGSAGQQPLPQALKKSRRPEAYVEAIARVAAAREGAQNNVNPQLLLAVLSEELAALL